MGEILDDTEIRTIKAKIKYTEKLLKLAEEAENVEKVQLYTYNIKHYQDKLSKI